MIATATRLAVLTSLRSPPPGSSQTKPWISGFGVGVVGCLAAAGAAVDAHPVYYAGLACGAAQLGWQVVTVDLDCRADCLRKFQSNTHFGAIIFAAIIAGKLLASQRQDADETTPEGEGGRAGGE